MAAVQGGPAGLVAVAGAIGPVRPPSSADARGVPAGAAQTRIPTGRLTRPDEEERHPETHQRDRAAAPPHRHHEAPHTWTLDGLLQQF